MRSAVVGSILVLVASWVHAADCPVLDKPTNGCQTAIGKAGVSYLKAHLKAVGRCLEDFQNGSITGPDAQSVCRGASPASPPSDAKTAESIAKAITKGTGSIAKKCTDGQVAQLSLCSATVAGLSCLFDEHYAQADAALEAQAGALVASGDLGEQDCQSTIIGEGQRYLVSRVKAVQKCLKDRQKACDTDKPFVRCFGPAADGPKAEGKLIAANDKATARLQERIGLACNDTQAAALDACASTAAGLPACLGCTHGNSAEDSIGTSYRVVRTVLPGPTTFQAAADAADPGDTILLEPGLYETTEVTLKDPNLTVYGHKTCDAVPARAVVEPPPSGPNRANGVYACGSLALGGCPNPADNLLLQGFEANDYIDNDLYQVGLDGITYRDMVTGGPGVAGGTKYGPFPVQSNNVLVENCVAHNIADAAIYVGQSTNIIVRNNEVFGSVAGIEIENSGNALVESNYAHDNAAGILVFKLSGLPIQLSDCHVVRNNISTNNNGPNYGVGLVGDVPSGTGFFVISTDTTVFEGNTATGNNSWGLAIVDQDAINLTVPPPPPFNPPSPDQDVNDNSFINNTFTGNGTAPDPGAQPFEADVFFLPLTHSGNCESGNTFVTEGTMGGFAGLPPCPTPPVQPSCPVPALTPPTTTTSTTVASTSTTTTSTTLAIFTFTQIYTNYIVGGVYPKCSACHGAFGPYTPWVGADQATTYANIINMVAPQHGSMDFIEPSDSTQSYMMHKLDGTQVSAGGGGTEMPPGAQLQLWERDAIRAWINSGAPNN